MSIQRPSVLSIGTRLILLSILMVVVLFGGLGIFIASQNSKALRLSLQSKSASVADLAGRTGAEHLSTFNFLALDQLVDDMVKDHDVAFAGFYNDRHELVTKGPLPAVAGNLRVIERQLKDPISGAVIGSLRIGYKQDSISESLVRSILTVAAGTVAAIILFSIGIAIASKRLIIRPINRLCEFASQVARGDLSQKLHVASQDELGVLAASLNSMVESLNLMVKQVDKAGTELQRVSGTISGVSEKVVDAAKMQAEGVTSTSSAMIQIRASVHGVFEGIGTLSDSAAENSSAIMEMAANIDEVALNAESLAASVEDVSSSIIQMAYTVKQVGSSVENLKCTAGSTASSLFEMDGSVRQVEKRAIDTAAISEEVRRDAESGKRAVDATITGIGEIKHSWHITSEVIEMLSVKAENISAILSVIDEVAEQTNLLALNAAIIAAQAGEHGKGFAVVADEIKELAERTSSSTREIVRVIKDVQDETHRAVGAIKLAEERIDEGERLSQNSGEALAKILSGAQQATVQVENIARATMEQARGSQMIRSAMEQVSDMVAQIATATQEQVKGSEVIMMAVERMKGISVKVSRSTREQSKAGSTMATSTERIVDMIEQIKRACDEQMRGTGQIVHAAEGIRLSTSINLEATEVLGESVMGLAKQADLLKKVMGAFKV